MPPAISSQPKSVARVGSRRVWLGVVEVACQDQIKMAVAVHIMRNDGFDRRNLRQVWQR